LTNISFFSFNFIRGGRPRSIDDEKMIVIKKALEDEMGKAAICRTFGVKEVL
jgi:hypothetical protein